MSVILFLNVALAMTVSQQPGHPLSFRQERHPIFLSATLQPPDLFAGITLTADQARQRAELNREFGRVIEAQIERKKQLRLQILDSAGLNAVQIAHQKLLRDVRALLTPAQQILFDRNQSARNAYAEERKSESVRRRQSLPH